MARRRRGVSCIFNLSLHMTATSLWTRRRRVLLARQSSAQFDPLANLIRAGLNQPPARASTSGAWQDPSAPLPTDICSGGCPAAGARLPSCCLSAMAVFALFRLPVRCELLVCHAIIHEQSTVQFLEVVVAQ